MLSPAVASASAKTAGTILTTGADAIARLTPLKRILCLCPCPVVVGTKNSSSSSSKNRHSDIQGVCRIGTAVSDPYLARASPLLPSSNPLAEDLEVYWHSCSPSPLHHTIPEGFAEFKDWLDYSDIGAIAIALPMKNGQSAAYHEYLVQATKTFLLRNILLRDSFWGNQKKNALVYSIDDRVSWNEAQEMAQQDPDMWEEIMEGFLFPDDGNDDNNEILHQYHGNNNHPSAHAAVALNQFLWQHTGGWPNTFG